MKQKLIWLIVLGLSLFTVFIIVGSFMMPDGSQKVLERIQANGVAYQELTIKHKESFEIGVYTFGNPTGTPLLLIHGSPGDWSAWENVIANATVQSRYHIIAVDRPGYGRTTIPAQADLYNQSEAIWSVVKEMELSNIVLAGHSYGGAVVEQLLVDDQEYFSTALMVAATSSPELMSPRWYNKVANWSLVKTVLPNDLLSSNIEMVGLPQSLELIEDQLKHISTPIFFVQGGKDVLVPAETTDYFRQVKPTGVKYILPEDVNHFIPWSEPYLINDILINLEENENGI